MGVFTDLQSQARTIDFELPRDGIQRAVVQELKLQQDRLGDIAYPEGFAEQDEHQEIPNVECDDGTYTLVFTLADGTTFETAALDHDDDDETIQAAVDAAAAVAIGDGYTAGDIAISGGPIDTDTIEIDFTGDSVAKKNHGLTTVNSSLTLSDVTVTVTETIAGSAEPAVDEVQTITADPTITGGTYTLSFSLAGPETFTTDPIAFDADATAIQSAIDNGADGNVGGYSPGDIAVTGGPINAANIVLTFSGASVDEEAHNLTVVDGTELTVDADEPAVDEGAIVKGQTDRPTWAILNVLGVIDAAPAQGTANADDLVRLTTPAVNPHYPSGMLIRSLAKEAAYQDQNPAVEAAILTVCGLN